MEHYEIRMERGHWAFRRVGHLCSLGRGYCRMQVLVDALSHLKSRTELLHCSAELVVFRMKGGKEATYVLLPGAEPSRVLHPSGRSRSDSRADLPQNPQSRSET